MTGGQPTLVLIDPVSGVDGRPPGLRLAKDHDPALDWAEGYAKFGEQLDASGVAKHLWTAPFQQTVFGTDEFTDELW